jgi:hypothetical protein
MHITAFMPGYLLFSFTKYHAHKGLARVADCD